MIENRKNTDELISSTETRAPRVSWSVIMMGVGVVASIVLNYAAYDTRIAVLEENKLMETRLISDLKIELNTLRVTTHDLEVRVNVLEHDVANHTNRVNREVLKRDQINLRVLELEKKRGK